MDIRFDGKVAVVTGGTGGIGTACARVLLESGATVALVDMDPQRLREKEQELSPLGRVKGYSVNLSQLDSIQAGVQAILADLGSIDVLIQAAGLMESLPGLEVTEDRWDRILSVNAKGLFFMMQETVASWMAQHGGSIVNFSSMAGIRGMNKEMAGVHYGASKGAVVAITMQAAVEWAGYGVRVNAVAPGGVCTQAVRNSGMPIDNLAPVPMGRLSQPEEIAQCVAFLASDKAAMVTGQTLVIDGGSSVVGY